MEPVQRIIHHAAAIFQRTPEEILGRSRKQPIAEARQAVMWAVRQRYPSIPLERIGAALGGRHYTTVMHALLAVEERAERDSHYREQLHQLLERIDPPPAPPGPDQRAVLQSTSPWWYHVADHSLLIR